MKQYYIFLVAFLTASLFGLHAQTLGYAMCFDGLNDFAPVYRSTETGIFGTNANNDSFTIEFWVKDNGNGGKHMYSKHYDTGSEKQGYFIEKSPTGTVTVGIANTNNAWTTITGTKVVNDGAWHHIAYTFDFNINVIKLYVDGVWEGTASGFTAVFGNNVDARLASSEYENTYFGGAFDEFKVWNTVRTVSEINTGRRMQLDTSALPTGLIQYFQCNEGIPGNDNWILYQLLDHTGNGRPGDLWNVSRWGSCSNWVNSLTDATLSTETFEANAAGLNLYPNPAKDFIKINGLKTTEDYAIYNTIGAVVKSGKVSNNKEITIADLKTGLYFIKLTGNRTIKFIKQ
ncbi:LamG-like jellyroll fold domain-containing protein [Kordia sp.]|uniref:LamG-like jellyroll fold domain-containing protein n=1 Tax=Kordia sp. TaxID=1965332 RepID=UPI003B5A5565